MGCCESTGIWSKNGVPAKEVNTTGLVGVTTLFLVPLISNQSREVARRELGQGPYISKGILPPSVVSRREGFGLDFLFLGSIGGERVVAIGSSFWAAEGRGW